MDDSADTDINDIVIDEWQEATSTFERVFSVVTALRDAKTADEIAAKAEVDPDTARDHLRTLVTNHHALVADRDGERYYASNPAVSWFTYVWSVTQHATKSELVDRYDDLSETIQTYRDETGCETVEAYRQQVTDGTGDLQMASEDERRRISDWVTAAHYHDRLEDAICVYDIFARLAEDADVPVETPYGTIPHDQV